MLWTNILQLASMRDRLDLVTRFPFPYNTKTRFEYCNHTDYFIFEPNTRNHLIVPQLDFFINLFHFFSHIFCSQKVFFHLFQLFDFEVCIGWPILSHIVTGIVKQTAHLSQSEPLFVTQNIKYNCQDISTKFELWLYGNFTTWPISDDLGCLLDHHFCTFYILYG